MARPTCEYDHESMCGSCEEGPVASERLVESRIKVTPLATDMTASGPNRPCVLRAIVIAKRGPATLTIRATHTIAAKLVQADRYETLI